MLGDNDVQATIGVRDLARARAFYGETLGLALEDDQTAEGGVLIYRSGGALLVVYESTFAGTNQATSATWGVGDQLETIVETLRQAGVRFEHYDMPGLTLTGDIHAWGDFRAVWFKDPDGNILHVNSG